MFLLAAVSVLSALGQDVIVKRDGSTVLCKIIGVTDSEVIYEKWDNLNGPQFIMDRSLISNLNYHDGRQDKVNEQTSNAYAPGNQQTGASNYNDKALLALDYQRQGDNVYLKKAKKLKTIGWAVGSTLFIGGTVLILATGSFYDGGYPEFYVPGCIMILGGISTTIGCLVKANQYAQKAKMMAVAPMFNHEFNFKDGSSLCAGIDLIRDKRITQLTLGLGLQYTF